MADTFLRLPLREQAEILNGLAPELGRAAVVLEKDVWVCWVLQQLFQMPGRLPMAFKGGTSLSKVFDAINRFSEDVDVTLDYRGFDSDIDPFDARTSRSQIRKPMPTASRAIGMTWRCSQTMTSDARRWRIVRCSLTW
jgi:hypothetical protein